MDLFIGANTVDLAHRDVAPTSGTPGWATDGNPLATPPVLPTQLPAWWGNMIAAELAGVVDAAGLTRDVTDWTQLLQAMRLLFGGGGFSAGNPGYLRLPLGFILNFGNILVTASSTATLTYGQDYNALPLVALSNPGGTTASPATYPARMNVRSTGATVHAGTISNPNAFDVTYDWWVLGK